MKRLRGLGLFTCVAFGLGACVPSPGGDQFSSLHSTTLGGFQVGWEGSETTVTLVSSIREREGNTALCASHAVEGREFAKLTRQVLSSTAVRVNGVQLTRSVSFSALVSASDDLLASKANCIVLAEPWRDSFENGSVEFVQATTTFFVSE